MKMENKKKIQKKKTIARKRNIDTGLDNANITFTSNKLEEANKVLANLELPKFDKDGNYIP